MTPTVYSTSQQQNKREKRGPAAPLSTSNPSFCTRHTFACIAISPSNLPSPAPISLRRGNRAKAYIPNDGPSPAARCLSHPPSFPSFKTQSSIPFILSQRTRSINTGKAAQSASTIGAAASQWFNLELRRFVGSRRRGRDDRGGLGG